MILGLEQPSLFLLPISTFPRYPSQRSVSVSTVATSNAPAEVLEKLESVLSSVTPVTTPINPLPCLEELLSLVFETTKFGE